MIPREIPSSELPNSVGGSNLAPFKPPTKPEPVLQTLTVNDPEREIPSYYQIQLEVPILQILNHHLNQHQCYKH